MQIGIDASNIRSGGSVTHRKELLDTSKPIQLGIAKVIVFSGKKTLVQLKDQNWLVKITNSLINKFLFHIIV